MAYLSGMEVLWWLGAGVAFCGTACVSVFKAPRLGHALWIVANSILIVCNTYFQVWPMALLFWCYLGLSVWGMKTWKESA